MKLVTDLPQATQEVITSAYQRMFDKIRNEQPCDKEDIDLYMTFGDTGDHSNIMRSVK